MTQPKVTAFTGLADLGNSKKGLKNKDNSVSPAEITGTDFAERLLVTVTNTAGVTWLGLLKSFNGKWTSNLTCTNNSLRPKDTEDVGVTVGTSPVFPTTVEVGP